MKKNKKIYYINGFEFKTQKSLREYIQKNIYRDVYKDYENISEDHLRFMIDLLSYHEYSEQKIGCGVKRMWLQREHLYNGRCFWLERLDGSITDFSFYQCIKASPIYRDFTSACRTSILELMANFRREYFSNRENSFCPILGKPMNMFNSHVDHKPPATFDAIVKEFIDINKINLINAPLAETDDGKIGNYFTDSQFEENWINFHNIRADLRVISAEANLKRKQEPQQCNQY